MKRKGLLLLLLPLIIAGGCKKDNNEKGTIGNGTYTGKAIITPLSTPNAPGSTYVYNVMFVMQSGEFTSTKSATSTYLGSGTYQVNNQNIVFNNTAPTPVQTDNFPSPPWLNGTYTYSTKGDSVFFTLPVVPVNSSSGTGYTVEYKLKRS